MPHRRIVSLWFPRLGAERLLRTEPHLADIPFAVVREEGPAQLLSSLSLAASKAGLRRDQPLRDAHAMCADLVTRPSVAHQEAGFLGVLHRWAGKFSPWVASEPPDALVIDLTGCAHLFGGEAQLVTQLTQDCADLGLTVQLGIADTYGAAWALARYAGQSPAAHRNGDAIEQEAYATRAKAGKRRHWERGGTAPPVAAGASDQGRIAPIGQSYSRLAPLPVAALRIQPHVAEQLNRLGLRRVGDLLGQPRASLARRFGRGLVDRLDQATGAAPEPISPAAAPERFSTRLSLPEPIGLEEDVLAACERMLAQVCDRLKAKARGLRKLRLEAYRSDHTMQWISLTTAVAHHDAQRLLPLIALKLPQLEAGPGIDMLRIEVTGHEPAHARHMAGHLEATQKARGRMEGGADLDDLLGRLGARIGMEALTRRHPGQSHIPEKGAQTLAAAWSDPAPEWPQRPLARPLTLWPPEPVQAQETPQVPQRFRWRGRQFTSLDAQGPERIAPEWWLDEPAWRSGPRDYWRVDTDYGDRLWLYYAHGGAINGGWFCHGAFA